MSKKNDKDEIKSLNERVDIDNLTVDDLEDVAGGSAGCTGCNGIYTPSPTPRLPETSQ